MVGRTDDGTEHSDAVVFACRDLEDGPDRSDLLANLAAYLPSCRGTLMGVNHAITKQGAVEDMLRALDVYEVEVTCEMGEWDSLLESIKASDNVRSERGTPSRRLADSSGRRSSAASRPGPARTATQRTPWRVLRTYLPAIRSVPQVVSQALHRVSDRDDTDRAATYLVLEMILTSFSLASSGDVIRYARWLRAILLNLLHRGGEEDADRALAYLTKGAEVLRSTGGKAAYPADEAQWLLAQAWNKGLELFALVNATAWVGRALPARRGAPRLCDWRS